MDFCIKFLFGPTRKPTNVRLPSDGDDDFTGELQGNLDSCDGAYSMLPHKARRCLFAASVPAAFFGFVQLNPAYVGCDFGVIMSPRAEIVILRWLVNSSSGSSCDQEAIERRRKLVSCRYDRCS